jgi:WD40 repeat protein
VVLYDLASGKDLFTVPGRGHSNPGSMHSHDLTRVATWLTSPGFDGRARCVVWDLADQKKEIELEMPEGVRGLMPPTAFSPSGKHIVILANRTLPGAQRVNSLMAWDLTTGKKVGEVEVPDFASSSVIAVASDTSAVLCSTSRLLAVDYVGSRLGDDIDGAQFSNPAPMGPVVFSPDGKLFAAGVAANADGQYGVRLYDWPGGRALHTLAGHTAQVTALAFSHDGKTLASGSADTTVLLWDLGVLKKK